MSTTRITSTLVALAAGALIAAGCAPSDDLVAATPTPELDVAAEVAANEDPVETTEAPPTTEAEEEVSDQYSFGETAAWVDGPSVTVGAPVPFTVSEYAAGAEGLDAAVSIPFTVLNDSDVPFDVGLMSTSVTSGTAAGSEVFDSANGVEGAPYVTILPGKTLEYAQVFAVQDAADVTLQVAADFGSAPAYFTS